MAPRPILFMIQHLDQGGTEHHFHDVVTGLDRDRFEPHVIHFTGGMVADKLRRWPGLPVTRLRVGRAYGPSGLVAAGAVRRYLRRHRVQALVTFHFVADFIGAIAGAGRVPVISSRRDMGFTRTRRQRQLGRWLDRGVTRYIAVAEAVRQAVCRDEGVDPEKIEVIYNGIDLPDFDRRRRRWDRTVERRREGIEPGEVLIGCVSNFNPVKGHLRLLEAFAGLQRRCPGQPIRLMLTGDGPMRDRIEERIDALGIARAVIRTGLSEDITREYEMADVAVLPSDTEGFSNSILQAMACGRAMVACRVGGNAEAIEHARTGLLTPAGDAEAMSAALERLIADASLRRRMGLAARQRLEQRFTHRHMLEQIEALIERVIERRFGRSRGRDVPQ